MHAKNNLNFVFNLSEIHAFKEQFVFYFSFKCNTFMKKTFKIFFISQSEVHECKEQFIYFWFN